MAGKSWNVQISSTSTTDLVTKQNTVPPLFPGGKLERAWEEGRQASANSVLVTANPFGFPPTTPQGLAWGRGHAQHDDSQPAGNFVGSQFQSSIPDQTA